jgi:hypothetical protein
MEVAPPGVVVAARRVSCRDSSMKGLQLLPWIGDVVAAATTGVLAATVPKVVVPAVTVAEDGAGGHVGDAPASAVDRVGLAVGGDDSKMECDCDDGDDVGEECEKEKGVDVALSSASRWWWRWSLGWWWGLLPRLVGCCRKPSKSTSPESCLIRLIVAAAAAAVVVAL